MQLSLGQAATAVGVSKSTLSRAIKTGRLSATRNPDGGYSINPAELERVYTFIDPSADATTSGGRVAQHATQAPPAQSTLVLEVEIQGLRAHLDLLRDQLDDVRKQRDGWQRQAEATQLLITGTAQHRRRSWWRVF